METVREGIKKYFDIQELVCKHVYNRHKEGAWDFIDDDLLSVLLFIREGLNKPIYVNSWQVGGSYTQRGYRCNCCALVRAKSIAGELYVSAHSLGKAADFTVEGMTAAEVRQWVTANADRLPHKVRMERGVSWVHIDVRHFEGDGQIKTFTA